MTVKIQLSTMTYGQLYAIVDDEDAADVRQYNWFVLSTGGKLYAYRSTPGRQNRTSVLLHRHIMKVDGKIDHINGDGLDCRRSNLRVATDAQNRWNARRPRSKSGYIGVKAYSVKSGMRYAARMNGIQISSHDTAEEAAKAYDVYARKLYGEFAVLNFTE